MKKIALCWIGIGNYNILFDEMYKSFNSKFCNDLDKTFFIFTDRPQIYQNISNALVYTISNACQHKGFIMFRKWKYCLMAEDQFLKYDYVAFINANLVCKENIISTEIISIDKPITAVSHPCDTIIKANTPICDIQAQASFTPTDDWQYKQDGFCVLTKFEFLKMLNTIESWRHLDKVNNTSNFISQHDETYVNKYYYLNREKLNILDGKKYLFPTDVKNLQKYFDSCKIYTRDKRQIFINNNLQFQSDYKYDLY